MVSEEKEGKMNKLGCIIAIAILVFLVGCQATSSDEKLYQSGLKLIEHKCYPQAIGVLRNLEDYKDSKVLVTKIRYVINGNYIGAGYFFVSAIQEGGTVIRIGGYEDSKSINEWKHIETISTHGEYIECNDENGKVLTSCPWTSDELESSTVATTNAMSLVIKEVTTWGDVIGLQSDYPRNVIALLDNGTVKVASSVMNEDDVMKTSNWKDIVAVAEGGSYVLALKEDGTVEAAGDNVVINEVVTKWRDIVALSASGNVVGLKEDGTVISTGLNSFGKSDIGEWTDIIAIATGEHHTVGLKVDGTVISTGDNTYGQCDTVNWHDIVAIDASEYFTLGLKSDGTLVIAGDCSPSGAITPDVKNVSGLLVPKILSN